MCLHLKVENQIINTKSSALYLISDLSSATLWPKVRGTELVQYSPRWKNDICWIMNNNFCTLKFFGKLPSAFHHTWSNLVFRITLSDITVPDNDHETDQQYHQLIYNTQKFCPSGSFHIPHCLWHRRTSEYIPTSLSAYRWINGKFKSVGTKITSKGKKNNLDLPRCQQLCYV